MTETNVVKSGADAVTHALAKSKKKGTFAGLKHRDIQTVFESLKPSIAQALPRHLTADRMIQMSATLISRNPKIAQCSVQSLVGAVMQASILGFKPVEALGECYFVPYGNEVQFQIGYKGLISLARKSGKIKTIYAEVVYAEDEFIYELGLDTKLIHKPQLDGDNKDSDIKFAYAVAKYIDGGYNFVVITRKKIESLRLRSSMQKAAPSGAWKTDYPAMARAKAIKQLSKYLPLENEESRQIYSDEQIITPDKLTRDGKGYDVSHAEYSEYELEQDPQNVDTETGEVIEEPKPDGNSNTKDGKMFNNEPTAEDELYGND